MLGFFAQQTTAGLVGTITEGAGQRLRWARVKSIPLWASTRALRGNEGEGAWRRWMQGRRLGGRLGGSLQLPSPLPAPSRDAECQLLQSLFSQEQLGLAPDSQHLLAATHSSSVWPWLKAQLLQLPVTASRIPPPATSFSPCPLPTIKTHGLSILASSLPATLLHGHPVGTGLAKVPG